MLYGMNIAKLVFPLLTLPYLTRVLSVQSYAAVAYLLCPTCRYWLILVSFFQGQRMLSRPAKITNP